MPGHKKPNPIRRNKPQQPDLRLVVDEVPDVPEWMSPEVAEWWSAYWASDLAAATYAPTNHPALLRLFHMYEEEATMAQLCREDAMLVGSQGQPVANPAWRILAGLRKELRLLEDRFGLSPRSRLALGIEPGTVKKTIEDLAIVDAAEDLRD